MLFIILMGVFATITSVFGDCDPGTKVVNNFDWTKVGISVLIRFLRQTAFETAVCVYVPFVYSSTNCQYSISD
jgi:hypothetical protein